MHEHARDGWRLVQIFAPGVAAFGAAKYYELIFERERAEDATARDGAGRSVSPVPHGHEVAIATLQMEIGLPPGNEVSSGWLRPAPPSSPAGLVISMWCTRLSVGPDHPGYLLRGGRRPGPRRWRGEARSYFGVGGGARRSRDVWRWVLPCAGCTISVDGVAAANPLLEEVACRPSPPSPDAIIPAPLGPAAPVGGSLWSWWCSWPPSRSPAPGRRVPVPVDARMRLESAVGVF